MFEKRVQKDQDSRREEEVLIELQVIIIPKRPQHCPGRFMTASLNKQRVKEKKSFIEETKRKKKKNLNTTEFIAVNKMSMKLILPFRVSPLSLTPSPKFFFTTFFTSSSA